LIKNEDNPFYLKKTKINYESNFSIFYRIWKDIINKKIKKGEIEYIQFNLLDKKIKNLRSIAINISEINSSDPRLILLWNFNSEIKINIWFKKNKIGLYSKKEFIDEFIHFDISKREDWFKFLYFFPTNENPPLKGIGWKKIANLMEKNNLDENRINNLEKIINEMA
jgi:hypothetical protein